MVEQIKVVYDLELIHLYVQSAFKTIMKIILSKIQTYDRKFNKNVINILKDFYEQFISDSYNLPSMIVEIFAMFNDFNGFKHNELLGRITSFMKLVPDIFISLENQLLSLSLENFLEFLLDNVDSVRCFIRHYEFLRGEYRRYYVPFSKDSKKIDKFLNNTTSALTTNEFATHISQDDGMSAGPIELFVDENPNYGEGCKYIEGLNYYCFMTVLALNSGPTMHPDVNFYYEINDYLGKIYYLLKRLVSDTYYDRAVYQTVYRTIPLIEIHSKRELITDEISHFLRLVYAVIFELKAYILQHCRIPEFKYWYPHNMSLRVMGRFSTVESEISRAWNRMIYFGLSDYTFHYIHVITPDLNQNALNVYEKKILFHWKSEKKNIRYIETSTKGIILISSYSYVFYDVCIKFFAAVTFYGLSVLYNRVISNDLTRGSWCKVFLELLSKITQESRFPLHYKYILIDIEMFLIFTVNKVSKKTTIGSQRSRKAKL